MTTPQGRGRGTVEVAGPPGGADAFNRFCHE